MTLNGQSVPVLSTDGGAPFRFEGKLNLPAGSNTVTVQGVDGRGNMRTNHYGVTTTGTTALYRYDGDGNLRYEKSATGVVTREYRWDAQDRLVRIVQGTHESVFDYDGESRRVQDSGARQRRGDVQQGLRLVWLQNLPTPVEQSMSTGRAELRNGGVGGTGTTRFITADHLTSTREVLASDGITIDSASEYSLLGQGETARGRRCEERVRICRISVP